jgi:hypothetical protein
MDLLIPPIETVLMRNETDAIVAKHDPQAVIPSCRLPLVGRAALVRAEQIDLSRDHVGV